MVLLGKCDEHIMNGCILKRIDLRIGSPYCDGDSTPHRGLEPCARLLRSYTYFDGSGNAAHMNVYMYRYLLE